MGFCGILRIFFGITKPQSAKPQPLNSRQERRYVRTVVSAVAGALPCACELFKRGISHRNKRYRNKRGRKFRANLRTICKKQFRKLAQICANLRKFRANFAQIRPISRKFGKFCMFPIFFDLHHRLLHPRLFRSKYLVSSLGLGL